MTDKTDKTKGTKSKNVPTETEIYATADVITARYLHGLDPDVALHGMNYNGTARILVTVDGLVERAGFLDIDEDGVYVHGTERGGYKILTKSIRNVVKIIEDARPYFKRIVETLRIKRANRRADDALEAILDELYRERGMSRDDVKASLPIRVGNPERGRTEVSIFVPNDLIGDIAGVGGYLERALSTVLDLIHCREATTCKECGRVVPEMLGGDGTNSSSAHAESCSLYVPGKE
jgi:hypothetical protein